MTNPLEPIINHITTVANGNLNPRHAASTLADTRETLVALLVELDNKLTTILRRVPTPQPTITPNPEILKALAKASPPLPPDATIDQMLKTDHIIITARRLLQYHNWLTIEGDASSLTLHDGSGISTTINETSLPWPGVNLTMVAETEEEKQTRYFSLIHDFIEWVQIDRQTNELTDAANSRDEIFKEIDN